MARENFLRAAVVAGSLAAMPFAAHATMFDFTTFTGATGYLSTSHLDQTQDGITVGVDSYYGVSLSDNFTTATAAMSLYKRTGSENGLGICNDDEYAGGGAGDKCGSGNFNELSSGNGYALEEMLLTKSGGAWNKLILDSLDNGSGGEHGMLYWSDSGTFDNAHSASFSYTDISTTGNILPVMHLNGTDAFNATAKYLLLTPDTSTLTTTNNNDFLVSKTQIVPEPGTLALLGLGLVALGFSARRRAS